MSWSATARSMTLFGTPWRGNGVRYLLGAAAFCMTLTSGQAWGIALLDASDSAIALDTNAVFALNGRYPTAEGPAKAIDQSANAGDKYLNFGKEGSGFIVTPFAAIPVESFQITTANDSPGRDPASWALYGYNGALTTVSTGPSPAINPDGLAEAWTLIASGSVALPGDPNVNGDQRGVAGPLVVINPSVVDTGYDNYKMIFPTLKATSGPGVDSLQFAEIQFFDNELGNPGGAFLSATDSIIAVDGVKAWNGSSYPAPGETPAKALDQLSSTKYLNFGKDGSGLIITNSGGAVTVGTMQLTTAGDATNRDPASYELYGTNDPIQSMDNTNGLGGENWTPISSGALSLPLTRQDSTTFVPINAGAAYTSYKLIFPTLRNAPATNSMQIADVQFYTEVIPEPATFALVAIGLAIFGVARRRA
jgi:hypothetical protein